MRQCSKCGRRFEGGETVCPHDGTLLGDSVSFEEQAVGKTLDGKYRIDGFLKRGGMGAVYRGTHLMLSKPVAIKLIKPELVSSTDVVQRFLREARAAAHLSHPNIVTVHDLGQTSDGMLYIAMELVDGSSLKELIVSQGAWEPKRAIGLLKGIGSALALAHREGIVHRDLKPQNIMVSRDSDGNEFPKLLDFGIAKTFEPTSPALTSTGMVLGTPHYMSAEQAKGQPADQRSDLYALGVILYEMLVGKVPFDDKSIPQILIKHLSEPPKPPSAMGLSIPPKLEAVVLRCLEKDPDARYQNAEALLSALDTVPDTVHDAVAPTVAEPAAPAPPPIPAVVPRDEPTRATRETTMAGAAAPAVTSPSGTVRAHELRDAETKSGAARFVLFGVVIIALALAALFLLRGRGGPPAAPIEQAVVAATPDTPEPSEAAGGAPAAAAATGAGSEPSPDGVAQTAGGSPSPEPVTSSDPQTTSPRPEPPSPRPAQTAPPIDAGSVEPVRTEPAPPPPPPLPEIPVAGIACEGVRDGCAALRFAIVEEAKKRGVPIASPPRGDVIVHIGVDEIEARQEEQFGTTFVVRTYSIEATGTSPHFGDELYLEPKMISFDARRGREKLREESRLIARDVMAAVQDYWSRNSGIR